MRLTRLHYNLDSQDTKTSECESRAVERDEEGGKEEEVEEEERMPPRRKLENPRMRE